MTDKQPKPKKITMRQIEAALRKKVAAGGTPEEQKRKADWFKEHVIVIGMDDKK